jgi:DNA-binding NarL/FixJ family response regulator
MQRAQGPGPSRYPYRRRAPVRGCEHRGQLPLRGRCIADEIGLWAASALPRRRVYQTHGSKVTAPSSGILPAWPLWSLGAFILARKGRLALRKSANLRYSGLAGWLAGSEESRRMIRILLAEDHAMVRAGLRTLLEHQKDIVVVAEAADGADAVSWALRLQPDVAILDVGLPGIDGLDALERIKARASRIRVLLISGMWRSEYLTRALRAGASGFLLKEESSTELVRAVRAVARGGLAFAHTGDMASLDAQLYHGNNGLQPPRHSELTDREREVLRLVALGYSNSEIAEQLAISPKTVDTHRTHVMEKLGLHSRAELTRYALQHGYLTVA